MASINAVVPLPSYGNDPDLSGYQEQSRRGKIVTNTRAPAFIHGMDEDGGRPRDRWVNKGIELISQCIRLDNAQPRTNRPSISELLHQLSIDAIRPLSEQDVVKISHARILRVAEEIFIRIRVQEDSATQFRSMAEQQIDFSENDSLGTILKGKAGARADNLFVLVKNHGRYEPARFPNNQPDEGVKVVCALEYKKRGGLPVNALRDALERSEASFREFSRHEDPKITIEDRIKKWENNQLVRFSRWEATGDSSEAGGLGVGRAYMQQKTAYSLSYRVPIVLGSDYDNLTVSFFHHVNDDNSFAARWRDGRGGGGCCRTAVFGKKESGKILPAIVGCIAEAIKLGELVDNDEMDLDDSGSENEKERRNWIQYQAFGPPLSP